MSEPSLLDDLGEELVAVITPVSISMLTVVIIISLLSSSSSSSSPPPPITSAATLFYTESPSDSISQKLSGALLDAAAFVVLLSLVTFLLLLLYYFRFTSLLSHYSRLSSLFVLLSMGGSLLLSLLRRLSLPLDALSFLLFVSNFSVVGVLSLFSPSLPILLRQSFTLTLAVIVAAWFSRLPEWTTWTLLLALSLYDLLAVLCPAGPLRLLLDLAASRNDDLPALVYESRPSLRPSPTILLPSTATDIELQPQNDTSPLMRAESNSSSSSSSSSSLGIEVVEATRGIRLGLGDFVFYSVLVGRAAMYDMMTVYACYLVVVSGLGCTLVLLAVWQRALPALPISITLGVGFYFLTRLLTEPFVVGAATKLVMF